MFLWKLFTKLCWFLTCPAAAALTYRIFGGTVVFRDVGVVAAIVALVLTLWPIWEDGGEPNVSIYLGWLVTTGVVFGYTGFAWHWPIVLPDKLVDQTLFLSANAYIIRFAGYLLRKPIRSFTAMAGW